MNSPRFRLAALLTALLCVLNWLPCGHGAEPAGQVRVLLVTGGHDYDTNQLLQVFRDNPNITFTHVAHPQPPVWLDADHARQWDVLVLYDFWQDIDDPTKSNFLARLQEGKGLVVLHHAIADYQNWPEYERVIGARYYLADTMRDGVKKLRSLWQHDVDFHLHVAAPDHPVTRGVKDFDIHDETYKLYDVHPDVTVLLHTDEPKNEPNLAWAKTYGPARVVYLQLGHDRQAYVNPNYRRLLANAIQWTAHRE